MLPVLRGRVTLRRLRPADLADFQAYRSDPGLGRYQGWQPMPDAQALAFLQQVADEPLLQPGEWSQIAIADPATDRLLGDIGLFIADALAHAEIGFTLARPLHGRGLATEAVNAAIGLVFQHRAVPRIIGITDARNAASCRLLERVGMRRVSTDEAVFRGEPCLEHTYALDRPPAADAAPQTVVAAVQALVLYSLAEHQGGGARTVRVTVAGDAFSVTDDGRGHAIDKTIDGVSYLRVVYTHFEHPFGLAQAPPVQLQGIGLSLLNALCSEFSVTVHKRDATLCLQFRDGRLTSRHRADAASPDTGLHIAGRVQPGLCGPPVPLQGLRQWLQGVQAASPTLSLLFNGQAVGTGGPPG